MGVNANFSVNPLGYQGINIAQQPGFLGNQVRAPNGGDLYPAGWIWDYVAGTVHTFYISCGGQTVGNLTSGVWTAFGSSSGDILAVNGTANQVTVITASGTATVSLPSAITTPGSLTTTTTLTGGTGITATTGGVTASAGNITATNGNLVLGTAGNKLSIATGANASVGTSSAMTAGAVTVANTSVTASSIIFAVPAVLGTVTAPQAYYISAKVANTSFTITSADATDTSTWNYWIIN